MSANRWPVATCPEAAKRQRDGDLLEWEHDVESIVSYLGRVQNLPFPLPSTVEIPM